MKIHLDTFLRISLSTLWDMSITGATYHFWMLILALSIPETRYMGNITNTRTIQYQIPETPVLFMMYALVVIITTHRPCGMLSRACIMVLPARTIIRPSYSNQFAVVHIMVSLLLFCNSFLQQCPHNFTIYFTIIITEEFIDNVT